MGQAIPSRLLLIGRTGHLIGIDQDAVARKAATERLFALPDEIRPRIDVLAGNFGDLDSLLVSAQVPAIDAILFDLGVSSVQIDTPSRGFSFKETGPLDMRMDPSNQTLTAAEIINTYTAADLTRIIRMYSDEKWASRIAEFVVRERAQAPITESEQLVDIIKAAVPASARRAGGHPAKRTFQALRIEVNGELDAAPWPCIRCALACPRRSSRRHQLPLVGRPHRQGPHAGHVAWVHLPARSSRVRLWEQADTRRPYAQTLASVR